MADANKKWTITTGQLRAGRILARLGFRALADLAELSTTAICQIENGHTTRPHRSTLEKLEATLTAHGVEFMPGGWVRLATDADHAFEDSKQGKHEALIKYTVAILGHVTKVLKGESTVSKALEL